MLKKMSRNYKKQSDYVRYGGIAAFVIMQVADQYWTAFPSSYGGTYGAGVRLCDSGGVLEPGGGRAGRAEPGARGDSCAWVRFSSAFFSKCMSDVITAFAPLRFLLALLIGIAVAAAVFGLLIGIPVLRLKGDYLAIVTLAFGEIIKNLVNVLFIGQ